MSNFRPTGYRVLVKLDPVEEKTESGFVLYTQSEKDRQQRGHDIGRVIALGPECWNRKDLSSSGRRWCDIGDRVMFPRYAGHAFKDNDEWYHVMNDDDILGVFHD